MELFGLHLCWKHRRCVQETEDSSWSAGGYRATATPSHLMHAAFVQSDHEEDDEDDDLSDGFEDLGADDAAVPMSRQESDLKRSLAGLRC